MKFHSLLQRGKIRQITNMIAFPKTEAVVDFVDFRHFLMTEYRKIKK